MIEGILAVLALGFLGLIVSSHYLLRDEIRKLGAKNIEG